MTKHSNAPRYQHVPCAHHGTQPMRSSWQLRHSRTAAPEGICEHSISDPACPGGQRQHLREQPPDIRCRLQLHCEKGCDDTTQYLKALFLRLPQAEPRLGPGWHLVVALRSALRFPRGQKSHADAHRWATTAAAAASLQDDGGWHRDTRAAPRALPPDIGAHGKAA